MATRVDVLTALSKKQEYFSDFLTTFAVSPVNNNLGKITNEEAVKQSIRNLINTNLGERLFQPTIGSDVRGSLFENKGSVTYGVLKFNIENTIKFNERRAILLSVDVGDGPQENSVDVTIVFTLINNPEPISLSFILKRVR